MCQSYLLLFVYQSQSPLNRQLQTALDTVSPFLSTLIFQVRMHAVVVLFVSEQSSIVSSRGSYAWEIPIRRDLLSLRRGVRSFTPIQGVLKTVGVALDGAQLIASGLSTEDVETILHSRAPSARNLSLKWIVHFMVRKSSAAPS